MKTYVLDTSVLIHDPNCLLAFQDNQVRIPVEVIHEIDRLKTEPGERGRAARSVQRKLLALFGHGDLTKPVKTPAGGDIAVLLIRPDTTPKTKTTEIQILEGLGRMDQNDHFIIAAAYRIQQQQRTTKVALISKDMGMILKARVLGIHAEDYKHDKVEEIPNGSGRVLAAKPHEVQAFASCGDILLESLARKEKLKINQHVILGESGIPARHKGSGNFVKLFGDRGINIPEGIHIRPLNLGQEFLLDALLDPNITLVTVRGPAGTGKTLISLAAGLVLKHQKVYNQIIVTKPIVSMGKDLGALPGTLEEKMKPWLQPYADALDFLFRGNHRNGEGPQEKPQSPRKMNRQQGKAYGEKPTVPVRPKKPYDRMIEDGTLQIEALTYIRGRSIPNAFFITDECLTLDTLVWTDDGKALPIDELQPNDGVTSYNLGTQREEADKIQGKIRRTTKWATKVQTTAGTLEGSTNHPLWVYHQGAILCKKWMWDVLPGDLIPIATKMPHVVKNNFQEREAALAALIICDGHISQQGYTLQCEMSKDQKWLRKTWMDSIEILETEYNCIKPTKRGSTLCRAYGKETIKKWAESLGIPCGKKSHKVRVPQQIWNAPEESVKTFLRLCFDCEGDVNPGTTGASINFNSTSRRLSLEIQQLLRKFGIISNTHKIPTKRNTTWRVIITGEDIEPFLQNIGFSIPRKQAALQEICKTSREDTGTYPIAALYEIRAQKCGTAPRLTVKTRTSIQKIESEAHSRLRTDKTTSITKSVFEKIQNAAKARGFSLQDYPRCARVKHVETRKRTKEVVDYKVEKNATFIANGLVTSNCQNLAPIEIKTILTRIAKGSKIVLLGDEDQIDNPYLDRLSNGLTYVRTKMDNIPQAAHIHLIKGERSEISDIAAKCL